MKDIIQIRYEEKIVVDGFDKRFGLNESHMAATGYDQPDLFSLLSEMIFFIPPKLITNNCYFLISERPLLMLKDQLAEHGKEYIGEFRGIEIRNI